MKTKPKTKRPRFYYTLADAPCRDTALGVDADDYITDTLAHDKIDLFREHLRICFSCAVRVANAKAVKEAREHYGIPLHELPRDRNRLILKLRLRVINFLGEDGLTPNNLEWWEQRRKKRCKEPTVGDMFLRYLNGDVMPEERQRVETHVSGCEICQGEMKFFENMREAARK